MAKQPQKKVKRFAQKKTGPTIAQSSKKRSQVPVRKTKAKAAPVAPQPPVQPQPVQQSVPQPVQQQVMQQPVPQPLPQQVFQPVPQQPVPQQVVQQVQQPNVQSPQNPLMAPTQYQQPIAGQSTAHYEKPPKKVLKGKFPITSQMQNEIEDLKDEVTAYLEFCDSCLEENSEPTDLVDVLHMMVRSFNFDVVTLALLNDKNDSLTEIKSRGYINPPPLSVIDCWNNSVIPGLGIDWKKLMRTAENTATDLAYWIVQEGLDSIGYIPVRDTKTIYGFIFVAQTIKREQSSISSLLFDASGSRLGLLCATQRMKGEWPKSVINLGMTIRNQLSLLMGYTEILKSAQSLPSAELNEILDNCNKTIIETTQVLDSMISEAVED